MTTLQRYMVGLSFAFLLSACSSTKNAEPASADQKREVVMNELTTLLRTAGGTQNKIPAKVSDLSPFSNGAPMAYEAVRSGQVIVVWGATLPGEGDADKASDAIVAYEKVTPESGGYVLMQNGKVKNLSAADFVNAPKAK